MKVCSKCNLKKSLEEFAKDKYKADGLTSQCKVCVGKRSKSYYKNNKKLANQKSLKRYYNNKESRLEYQKQYDALNQDKKKEYIKQWQFKNKDKVNDAIDRYHKSNPNIKKWRDLLTNTINRTSSAKNTTTEILLGYTHLELKDHLDKQGMDWSKHHIDHKIPMSWFNELTPPHIINDLRNLQPLTEQENKRKLNRFCSPTDSSYIELAEKWIKPKYKDKLCVKK